MTEKSVFQRRKLLSDSGLFNLPKIKIEYFEKDATYEFILKQLKISKRTILARGGNGIIYASCLYPNCIVKEIMRDSSEKVQPFILQEFLANRLGIAPHIHKMIQSGNRNFIVMDKVEGVTLREWSVSRAHSFRDRLEVLLMIFKKTQLMNQLGIIHNDINALNVMIENETNRAIFVDFDQSQWKTLENPIDSLSSMRSVFCETIFETRLDLIELIDTLNDGLILSFFKEKLSKYNSIVQESDLKMLADIVTNLIPFGYVTQKQRLDRFSNSVSRLENHMCYKS